MKLEVLGTNAAFAKDGVNNSFICWKNDEEGVLLDCGFSVYQKLLNKDYAKKIKTVLLSHLHQDHCGSAINLLDYRFKILNETTAIGGVDWSKFLKLHSGDGWEDKVVPLSDDFPLATFDVPHAKGMDCRALFLNSKLLYSGDSAISLLNRPEAIKAQMIIHDVSLQKGGIIVCVDELDKAPAEIKAKTYLSHYLPKDFKALQLKAEKYGLGGVLRPGKVFEL